MTSKLLAMNESLKVVGIQSDLIWENPEPNRQQFEEKINILGNDSDLIVLPEMFTTGFSMNADYMAEGWEGPTLSWMKNLAEKHEVALIGSIIFKEKNQFFNRLFFVQPNGETFHYDKRHTFTLAGEHKVYTSGETQLMVEYKGWKICPFICYDLRFPVWSRNVTDYDVLIYIASWPIMRIRAWDTLLKARAIENMSYVIGVNRVGKDANEYVYSGHSAIINHFGEPLSELPDSVEGTIKAPLTLSSLRETRKKLGFLNDKDRFKIL